MRARLERVSGTFVVILLTIFLVWSAFPADAVHRNAGEKWTYHASMTVDVAGFTVDVSGNVTYEFVEERTILSFGDANVVTFHGTMSGTKEMYGEPFLDASVILDGFLYETVNGAMIYEVDTHVLIDATIGSGSEAFSIQNETETVEVYTSPYLSGFYPEGLPLGERYILRGEVNRTVTTWMNGTLPATSSDTSTIVYDFYIWPDIQSISTPAGSFDTLRIDISQDGDKEIRWWSNEVNGYVMIESRFGDETAAVNSMILINYGKGSAGSMLWIAVVGVAFALLAAVVLVIVIMQTRHPKGL